MRAVKFRYWNRENKAWVNDVTGKFHRWAEAYEEFQAGPGNYTCAVIELPSGHVVTAMPEDVLFLTEDVKGGGTGI